MRSKAYILGTFLGTLIFGTCLCNFGIILGAILGHVLKHFGCRFHTHFQDPHLSQKSSKIDSKMEAFGSHFGDIFQDGPKCDFEQPSNENDHFLLPGGSQKPSKNGCENGYPKVTPKMSKKYSKWHPPGLTFGTKNDPKKRFKNRHQNGPSGKIRQASDGPQ